MFVVLVSFFEPIISLTIHGAVSRKYFDREGIDFAAYVSNALALLFPTTVLVSIMITWGADTIVKFTELPLSWMLTAALVALFNSTANVVLALYQVQKRAWNFARFDLLRVFTNLVTSCICVIGFKMGWQGRAVGILFASWLFSMIALRGLWKEGLLLNKIDKHSIFHVLRFGVPLIPHTLGAYFISAADRLLLTDMIGVGEAGIYTVGLQLTMLLGFLTDSFNKAWVPWFYENIRGGDGHTKRKIVRYTYGYGLTLFTLAFLFAWVAPAMLRVLVPGEYTGSTPYIWWLALAQAFTGMYMMFANYIFMAEKTYLLSVTTLFAAFLNIGMTYFLIHFRGALGAAQALAVTNAICFLVTWLLSMRVFKMPWALGRTG
jgi:O-antigen/teichoic acid export membrane protein